MSLLSLPPELLSDIFHLAHRDTFEDDPDPEEPEHDTSLTRDPICRTLLFFQREALFREVTGLSLDQFKLFVRTIVDNSQLGEFVRVLAAPWNVAGLKNSKEETKALLTNLSHVETLRIAYLKHAIEILLDKEFASTHLSNLRQLRIAEERGNELYGQSEEEDQLGMLTLYPNLVSLAFKFSNLAYMTKPFPTGQSLTRIKELNLGNLRHLPEENAAFVSNRFPNVRTLTLDSLGVGRSHLKPLLERLASSPTVAIESLTLISTAEFIGMRHENLPPPCDKVFSSFTQLTYLYLAQFSFSPRIGTSLRTLPHLATLGFGPGAIMEEDRILALVVGGCRLPSLKKLILDQVQEGRIGWSVEVEGNWQLHPDHAESPRHVAPDWEVPEFNPCRDDETFTVEGVEELIGDCEEAGIEVEGTVIEALEFMMVYEREAMICEDLWEEYEEDHEIKQLESEDLETTDSEAESEDDEEDDEDEDDE